MTHAATGRRCGSGNEGGDGLFAVLGDPIGGFFFCRAADFTNHNKGFRVGIVVEHFHHVEVGCAIDRISADADAGGLSVSAAGKLPDRLIGEGAGA